VRAPNERRCVVGTYISAAKCTAGQEWFARLPAGPLR